jgi:hypothetical protein
VKIKYVIFDETIPVLLVNCAHAEVRVRPQFGMGVATSAGFCSFVFNPEKEHENGYTIGCWEVETSGWSISLKLKPAKNDARLISKLLDGDN